jgi:truncated hemoglobin YjbI
LANVDKRTLYEKIGGDKILEKLVTSLFDKLQKDKAMKAFFKDSDFQ